jgi:hypothetical protein
MWLAADHRQVEWNPINQPNPKKKAILHQKNISTHQDKRINFFRFLQDTRLGRYLEFFPYLARYENLLMMRAAQDIEGLKIYGVYFSHKYLNTLNGPKGSHWSLQ